MTNPEQKFSDKLRDMRDDELMSVYRMLYPLMSGTAKIVSQATGFHISYVGKVIQGIRFNRRIEAALLSVIRGRLQEHVGKAV